jgi:hypothetical protein
MRKAHYLLGAENRQSDDLEMDLISLIKDQCLEALEDDTKRETD